MGSPTGSIIYILVLVAAFYLLILRPQQTRARQHAELLKSTAEGDTVITAGGLFGVVREVEEDVFRIEIADGVIVRVAKGAVTQKVQVP